MLRVITLCLIFLSNMLLQSTLFEYIEIFSVKPNTALVLIVSYAILRGDVEAAIVGFFAGLLQDAFFGTYIGLHALLCMITGYVCGKPFRNFYRESYFQPLFLTGLSILAYEFLFYISTFLFHGKIDIGFYMQKIILPETIYSLLLALPVYHFMYLVNRRIERRENLRRKAR